MSAPARQGLTGCLTPAAWHCAQAEDPETQRGAAAAAPLKHWWSVCGTPMGVSGHQMAVRAGTCPVRQTATCSMASTAGMSCLHRSPTCDMADGIWLVKVAGSAGLAGVLGEMGPSLSSSLLLPPCSGCTCTGEGRSEWQRVDNKCEMRT